MKFSVTRENLLEPLQRVAGVVERRQTLPILSNVLVAVKDDILSLTGTDQEVELSAYIREFAGDGEDVVTIPARKFLDICRSLPETAGIEGSFFGVPNHRDTGYLKYVYHLTKWEAEHASRKRFC